MRASQTLQLLYRLQIRRRCEASDATGSEGENAEEMKTGSTRVGTSVDGGGKVRYVT